LVRNPRSVLRTLSAFLEHDLDYDRILENRVGAVAKPNSSFRRTGEGNFNPIARWKQQLTPEQLTRIEGLVGSTLAELGYELATTGLDECNPLYRAWNRQLYRRFFELKLQSKKNSLLRALRKPLTSKDVDEVILVDESAAERMRVAARTRANRDLGEEASIMGRMAGQP
jgi:hypothetical protein